MFGLNEKALLRQQVSRLNAENEILVKELNALKEMLENVETVRIQQASEIATQEKQFEALQQTNKRQLQQFEKIQQEHRQYRERQQGEISVLAQENAIIISQLHVIQEEFERQFLCQEDRNALSQKEINMLERRLIKVRVSLEAHRQKNNILENNLLKLEAELEISTTEQNRLKDESNKILEMVKRKGTDKKNLRISKKNRVTDSKHKEEGELDKGDKFLIIDSGLFDEKWYRTAYQDFLDSGMCPIEHYLAKGASIGLQPSLEFETTWYLEAYPDVAESGINPLIHYIRHGKEEGRTPTCGNDVSQ